MYWNDSSGSSPVMQQPGMQPGYQPGYQPGMQPGYQPGMQPGMQPGYQPGMQPGMQPGYQPGMMQPGMMQPVMSQPMSGGWLQPPPSFAPPANCPPGLEYLALLDQLLIKQETHIAEIVLPYEAANNYKIVNSMGQKVFEASEETDCCVRQCCGPIRPFTIHIRNNYQQEVILVEREMKLCVVLCNGQYPCCGSCCQDEITAYSATRETLGSLRHNFQPCCPKFTMYDAQDNPILTLEGPCFINFRFEMCCEVKFEALRPDGTKVGEISKQLSGLLKEAFTDADNFGVQFPLNMDVREKALLMASVFLIDFRFFEKPAGEKATIEL